jgi:hypothetical protein
MVARQIRAALLSRAGTTLVWGPAGTGDPKLVVVDQVTTPSVSAGPEAWRSFQNTTAVAALQFSPVGYSHDGSRALVVVRMRCGPRCGHWLTASLTAHDKAWRVGDLLLVASDE